jgi:hypothetical protein
MTPSGSLKSGLFSVGDMLLCRGIHLFFCFGSWVVVLGYIPTSQARLAGFLSTYVPTSAFSYQKYNHIKKHLPTY